MGFTAAFVAAAVVGGAVASKMNKPPEMKMPDAPVEDPVQKEQKAQGAGDAQKKRAAAAAAQASTILTGPKGLGEVAPENQKKQSLLGY